MTVMLLMSFGTILAACLVEKQVNSAIAKALNSTLRQSDKNKEVYGTWHYMQTEVINMNLFNVSN